MIIDWFRGVKDKNDLDADKYNGVWNRLVSWWNDHDRGARAWTNLVATLFTATTATITNLTVTALTFAGDLTLTGNLIFNPTTKGIKGTTTNDSAATGNVGEIITTGTIGATNLTNNVITDIGSVNLTAGNWMLYGQIFFHNTTSVNTSAIGVVSITSGNSFTGAVQGVNRMDTFPASANSDDCGVSITQSVSIASSTPYYLKAFVTYALGQGQAGGILFGIRTR